MKKQLFCFLLAAVMLLSACSKKNNPPQETQQTDEPTAPAEINVVENGKSRFAILADFKEDYTKVFANSLQDAIASRTGVYLPVRSIEQADKYPDRIYVGSVGSAAELEKETVQNGFSVAAKDGTLAFYGKGALGYYRMEHYIKDTFLKDASSGNWRINMETGSFLHHSSPENETASLQKGSAVTHYLIYDAENESMRSLAADIANYISSNCPLKVRAASDEKSYDSEILLGFPNRNAIAGIERYVKEEDAFAVGLIGGTYAIVSSDAVGLVYGAKELVNRVNSSEGKTVELTGKDVTYGRLSDFPRDDRYAALIAEARSICGTYGTWIDLQMSRNQKELADQKLVEALVSRMGGSMALSDGATVALHKGYIVKVDKTDYTKTVQRSADGHLLIPKDLAKTCFGTDVPADAKGYVDVTAYCQGSSGFSLYENKDLKLAVITPADVSSFENPDEKTGGYSNRRYLERMYEFFHNPKRPEPTADIEQSRIVVDELSFDTQFIFDHATHTFQTFYSPAILTRTENGKTVLYVAYEISTIVIGTEKQTVTHLKRSDDGGKTFTEVGQVVGMRWGSLFELNGKLYLFGNHRSLGNPMLAEFQIGKGKLREEVLDFKDVGGGAPNSVAVANGRLYKAFNNGVLSAEITADLFDSKNWTASNDPQKLISRSEFNRITGQTSNPNNIFWFEEGNAIVGPDGEVYVMYRIDAAPTVGHTAFFKLSKDGTTLEVEKSTEGIVNLPYSQSKFSLRYDEKTGLYLALTSLSTAGSVYQRNVLGLVVSKDLIHWQVVDTLLVDRELCNELYSIYAHAFQYVDFVLEGEDLYFAVREAVGDTIRFHDANYFTVYKIPDFRNFISQRIG